MSPSVAKKPFSIAAPGEALVKNKFKKVLKSKSVFTSEGVVESCQLNGKDETDKDEWRLVKTAKMGDIKEVQRLLSSGTIDVNTPRTHTTPW